MRKSSAFAVSFWDSPIRAELLPLGAEYLWTVLHLAYGPNSEVSGICRVSIGQIAEDIGRTPDEVLSILGHLTAVGWCEYEHPVVWIRGWGNINDKLGTRDFRTNHNWLKHTEDHLDALPQNRVVDAFRQFHGLAEPAEGVSKGYRRTSEGSFTSLSTSTSASSTPTPTDRDGIKLTEGEL